MFFFPGVHSWADRSILLRTALSLDQIRLAEPSPPLFPGASSPNAGRPASFCETSRFGDLCGARFRMRFFGFFFFTTPRLPATSSTCRFPPPGDQCPSKRVCAGAQRTTRVVINLEISL